jgi:hypothetical protein
MGWALLGTVFLDSDRDLAPNTRLGINVGAGLLIAASVLPLALSVRRPGRDEPGWLLVPLDLLAVEPVFLGSVVEHYVEHPDFRKAIGTREEYARLTGTA